MAGPTDDLAAKIDLAGDVAVRGMPRGPIQAHLDAEHLPGAPSGRITAEGTLAGAPLALAAAAQRSADGTLHLDITKADWKSAHAEAALTLERANFPLGKLDLRDDPAGRSAAVRRPAVVRRHHRLAHHRGPWGETTGAHQGGGEGRRDAGHRIGVARDTRRHRRRPDGRSGGGRQLAVDGFAAKGAAGPRAHDRMRPANRAGRRLRPRCKTSPGPTPRSTPRRR